MKKLMFILSILLTLTIWSCSTEESPSETTTQRITQAENNEVLPVYGQHGFIERISGQYWAKISWYTDYDFPTFQPHYCTIYRNGIVIRDFVNEPNNISEIRLQKRTTQATFSITQTVIGVGTSAPVFLTVSKNNLQALKKE